VLASRRSRARSTRANVGLSKIDGVRLGGPELDSGVTNIIGFFFGLIQIFLFFSFKLNHFKYFWKYFHLLFLSFFLNFFATWNFIFITITFKKN
jgi:hypothetical protein